MAWRIRVPQTDFFLAVREHTQCPEGILPDDFLRTLAGIAQAVSEKEAVLDVGDVGSGLDSSAPGPALARKHGMGASGSRHLV